MVLTNNGFKKIKDIKENDYVLTHTNSYKKVLGSKKTGTKPTFKINAMTFDEIRCTENHKFYARKMVKHYPTFKDGKRGCVRTFNKPEWVECKDLTKGHYLGMAINQKSLIPKWDGITFDWNDGRKPRHKNELRHLMTNNDFWWIIGRYIGDGWIRSQGGIIICCGKHENNEIQPHLDRCNINYSVVEERTAYKIHIPLKEIELFVEPFGKGAENKHIPGFVFDLPTDLLKSFLDGYMSADGCYTQKVYSASSVSRELIYGLAQIVAKVYKTPCRVYHLKKKPKCIIENRTCNQKDQWQLKYKTDVRKQDKAFYEDGYIWFPIKSIEPTGESEDVYDIEVENDHSFTANGCIVHNCTDLSLAGKQMGMAEGSGTRSSLLWEVQRLLDECDELPDILVMENVTQVHSEKNMPHFRKWLDFLDDKGYTTFYQDMNAKNFGVAQNRDRTIVVSILGKNKRYKFPREINLRYLMKNYLDDEVDEKFYINNERSEKMLKDLIDRGQLE